MVGVPRSKGCKTCVQRRIKCDQTLPGCLRCKKRSLECPGYGQSVKFQDEGPRLREHFERKAYLLDETSSSSSYDSPPGTWTPPTPPSGFEPWVSPMAALTTRQTQDPYFYGLNEISSPNTIQTQLLAIFIGGISPKSMNQFHSTSTWLESLIHMPFDSVPKPLSSAIRALCFSHIGRTESSEDLIKTSRHHYGQALAQLSNAIRTSPDVEGMSSATLSTTMLLSFYEMFHCTTSNSWIRHAGGAGALMRARGPKLAAATYLDRAMFMAYRNALLVQSFEAGTAFFLDEPEWREAARRIHKELSDGSALSHLTADMFEELAKIPGLVKDSKEFPASVRDPTPQKIHLGRLQIKLRANGHRQKMKELYYRVQGELKLIGGLPVTKAAMDSGDILFPNQFHYPNVFIGSLHCGYWTCLTILNVLLIETLRAEDNANANMAGNIQEPPELAANFTIAARSYRPPPPLMLLSERINPFPNHAQYHQHSDGPTGSLLRTENIQVANLACRSIDYMINSAFIGPFFATFALRIALLAFPGERERLWCRGKLREIGKNLGMAKELEHELSMRRHFTESCDCEEDSDCCKGDIRYQELDPDWNPDAQAVFAVLNQNKMDGASILEGSEIAPGGLIYDCEP